MERILVKRGWKSDQKLNKNNARCGLTHTKLAIHEGFIALIDPDALEEDSGDESTEVFSEPWVKLGSLGGHLEHVSCFSGSKKLTSILVKHIL